MAETLTLTEVWDKTFPKDNAVHHRKVTFRNRYGITLAADLYEPKHAEGRLPAIAVCGPFGAVKEQDAPAAYRCGRAFGETAPLITAAMKRLPVPAGTCLLCRYQELSFRQDFA